MKNPSLNVLPLHGQQAPYSVDSCPGDGTDQDNPCLRNTAPGAPYLYGMRPVPNTAPEILRYLFWMWLPHWAFALMALALVLLTRSTTLGGAGRSRCF